MPRRSKLRPADVLWPVRQQDGLAIGGGLGGGGGSGGGGPHALTHNMSGTDPLQLDKLLIYVGDQPTYEGIRLRLTGSSVGGGYLFTYNDVDVGGLYLVAGDPPGITLDAKTAGGFAGSEIRFALDGNARVVIGLDGRVTLLRSQSGAGTVGAARALRLQNVSGGPGEHQEIGFGYQGGLYQPVVIGHTITDPAGQTAGDFYIATRAVVTDTPPVIRVRVEADGTVSIPGALTVAGVPVALQGAPPAAHRATHEPGGSDALSVDGVAGVGSLRSLGTGAQQAAAGTDARFTNARTPTAHKTSHEPGGSDALTVDAAAGVGSLRTLGTGATQAAAGNDPRFTASGGPPSAHRLTHEPGGSDALSVDGLPAVGSLRSLGTGAQQAAAGTDPRFTDARAPTAHKASHEPGGSDPLTVDAAAAVGSLRTLGTTALKAAAGNDPRFLGAWTVVANTQTGALHNWAPAGLLGNTLIEWSGAADAAITGFAGGVVGQLLALKNIGTKIATFAYVSASSSAGNRLVNYATSAPTPVAPGGYIAYQHDGTQWQIITHDQGARIAVPYLASNFTAQAGVWTVDAGDVTEFSFLLNGRQLTVIFSFGPTSTSLATSQLITIIPGLFTVAAGPTTQMLITETSTQFLGATVAGTTNLLFVHIIPSAAFPALTNAIHVGGTITLVVN